MIYNPTMITMLQKTITLFVVGLLGFILSRLGLFGKDDQKTITNLMLYITCPALVLTSITSQEVTAGMFQKSVLTIIISLILIIVAVLIGYVILRYAFRYTDKEVLGIYTYAFASLNSGFFGMPVSLVLFGQSVFYIVVIQTITNSIYLYGFGIVVMELIASGNSTKKIDLKPILTNMPLWASIIAVVMLFLGIKFPDMAFELLDMIGQPTTPLSMFIIGIMLSDCDFKQLFSKSDTLLISIVKMLVCPIIGFLILGFLPMDPDLKTGIIFTMVCPTAVIIAPIALNFGHDSQKLAEMIGISTVISVLTIPLCGAIMTSWFY